MPDLAVCWPSTGLRPAAIATADYDASGDGEIFGLKNDSARCRVA
jgi:hypothetical protein